MGTISTDMNTCNPSLIRLEFMIVRCCSGEEVIFMIFLKKKKIENDEVTSYKHALFLHIHIKKYNLNISLEKSLNK